MSTDWLAPRESIDWHAIQADRAQALSKAHKLLGAHPWNETLSVPVPDFLIPGLLQRKALHMISSEKGCYKTWLGLSMFLSGIYGTDTLGIKPASGFSTIYVAADSPDWDIGQQLRKLLLANSLKPDMGEDSFILPYGFQVTSEDHVNALTDLIVSHDIDHLVIDVKGYTLGHLSENDDQEQMLYYRVIKHFRDKLGIAVTLFHHFAKTTGKPRGAGTAEQALEHSFFLTKNARSGIVTIQRDKIRGEEDWKEQKFTLGRVNGGRKLVLNSTPIMEVRPDFTLIPSEVAEAAPDIPASPPDLLKMLPAPRAQLIALCAKRGYNQKWVDNKLAALKRKNLIHKLGKEYHVANVQ